MRTHRFLRASIFGIAALALVSSVQAEERKPGKIFRVDSSMADIVEPQNHTSNVIFLNRCAGGCTVYPGYDDSREDRSSIVAGTLGTTAFISEFAHGDTAWDAVVTCVRRAYEPYGVIVTDEDPGPNESHFEAIVAGVDDEINYSAGGVAPGGCGITNNAITFSFANQTNSVDVMCWTVAQETAHAFGLEHELLCEDPMTYLTDCGVKKTAFQDADAQCGEYENEPRQCYCTGSATQNSHQHLLSHFGPGTVTPPEVEIRRPAANKVVAQSFPIEVAAEDDISVTKVEITVNGITETLESPPWVINAPGGLTGRVQVQAVAYDNLNSKSETASVSVVIEGTLTAFGEECDGNDDCETSVCAMDGSGAGTCVQFCEIENPECPEQSDCVAAGDQSVCWPSEGGDEDSGCRAAGAASTSFAGLLVLALLLAARRRR